MNSTGLKVFKLVLCSTLALAVTTEAFAQGGKPYKKKVVSYVDNVLLPNGTSLTSEQTDYIRKTVSKTITFARFNYAPLPENVTVSFSAEAKNILQLTPENVKPVLDKTLAPQLLQILDVNKELFSKQNLTEAERNTFLATKAQAAGLSASQLEAILNSGFFYIPYVDFYQLSVQKAFREVKNDKGKVIRRIPLTEYTHALRLGLLWYKLNVDRSNNASVVYVGAAQGWKGEPIARGGTHEDETLEGTRIDDDGSENFAAFKSAVDVCCFNIQTETKAMEAFTLTGEVTDATFFGVKLNLGKKEGVGLDDTYWVEEFEETASGELLKNRRGFVKIREVGDNRTDETATSYAQTITGLNYSQGLSLTELPLLGFNVVIAVGTFPVSISKFDNTLTGFITQGPNFSAKINSESNSAVGASLSLQTDIANVTGVSELWVQVGGSIGLTSVDGNIYYDKGGNTVDSANISASLTGNISLGILKKFYFRRLGLVVGADVKFSQTRLSASDNNSNTYKLTDGNLGLDGKAGFEFYITPVFSIGAGAEYNVYGVSNSWNALITDKDEKETKNDSATGPDVKYSGLGLKLWVNYSLPSLK